MSNVIHTQSKKTKKQTTLLELWKSDIGYSF